MQNVHRIVQRTIQRILQRTSMVQRMVQRIVSLTWYGMVWYGKVWCGMNIITRVSSLLYFSNLLMMCLLFYDLCVDFAYYRGRVFIERRIYHTYAPSEARAPGGAKLVAENW